jgi:hypothetical protein
MAQHLNGLLHRQAGGESMFDVTVLAVAALFGAFSWELLVLADLLLGDKKP